MIGKQQVYAALVDQRKACQECCGLSNPAQCGGGCFDGQEIGPWTRWQGDLNASLMIVGQDWGDDKVFIEQEGQDLPKNRTNDVLRKLLHSIDINLGDPGADLTERNGVLLTNAILCLKAGGAQAKVRSDWFRRCGSLFLRPLIDLVNPFVVVCLGQRAYHAVMNAYGLPPQPFRSAVESSDFAHRSSGAAFVPVYHCGARILNTHRNLDAQKGDWRRVQAALQGAPRRA